MHLFQSGERLDHLQENREIHRRAARAACRASGIFGGS